MVVLRGARRRAEQPQAEDVVGVCDTRMSQRSTAALLSPSQGHHALSRVHCLIVLLSPYCLAVLFLQGFSPPRGAAPVRKPHPLTVPVHLGGRWRSF